MIIPNCNHARYLRKRIESIFAQTYQNFELILLDDCSNDNSRDILRAYTGDGRVRTEFNTENSGTPFKQWNKGVGLAQGKYVWIAESDDYANPTFLERLTGVLESDETIPLAYCQSWSVDEGGATQGLAGRHLNALDWDRWKRPFVRDGLEECRDFLF